MRALVLGLMGILVAGNAIAKPKVYVVDGDSLFIGQKEIRLSGIDAPEYKQECYDQDNQVYRCGLRAREAMIALVNDNIECDEVARDQYHRHVCVCKVDGVDINSKMVEQGWAVAYDRYSQDYVATQKAARQAKRGIWAGKFMKPELYRSLLRE